MNLARTITSTTTLVLLLLLFTAPPAGAKAAPAEGASKVWPYEPGVPDSLSMVVKQPRKGSPPPPVLAWVPEKSERIRAMLLIVANSDSKHFGEDPEVRKVAAKHHMAIVYMRFALQSHMDKTQDLMDHLAKQLQIEEFRHAPWVTFGKSSMGKFPYYMAWKYPDRTVATISYHAETPKWPMEDWSKLKDQTILHVSANGEVEWGGTFANHVRPSLLNYRQKTNLLAHQAVAYDVGHGDYVDTHGSSGWGKKHPGKVSVLDVWHYLAVYLDKALSLRLPEGFPTKQPFTLKQIDPDSGYLIEKFAVEDIFQKPRMDLIRKDGAYVVAPERKMSTDGFAAIPPAKDYKPAEGVPVVPLEPGKSPTQWLVTKGWGGFAMEADPMSDTTHFRNIRPEPGDKIIIDGKTATFALTEGKEIGRREGIERGMAMQGGLQPKNKMITVIGYTVLDVKQPGFYKVIGYHSLAVRLQVSINGRPVDHTQVVKLEKGLYPMTFGLRMKSVTWGHVEPALAKATDEEVAEAKGYQDEKDAKQAEFDKRFANGPRDPWSYVHKASEVPEGERRDMFWVADKEQAAAWIKLHNVERLDAEKAKAEARP